MITRGPGHPAIQQQRTPAVRKYLGFERSGNKDPSPGTYGLGSPASHAGGPGFESLRAHHNFLVFNTIQQHDRLSRKQAVTVVKSCVFNTPRNSLFSFVQNAERFETSPRPRRPETVVQNVVQNVVQMKVGAHSESRQSD
jgi:hypothetical protein